MKHLIVFVIMTFLAMPIFAFVVKSDELTSKYGVTYSERQNSNYIVKGGHSFTYLGNGTWDVKTLSTNNSSSIKSSTSSDNSIGIIVIFLLVVVGIIIIIGVSVSNITTTVAKNSGMSDEDAKKVGASAGVLAGTAATIATAVLLGKSGGVKRNPNDITITHKRG